jgi:hypothetical protein
VAIVLTRFWNVFLQAESTDKIREIFAQRSEKRLTKVGIALFLLCLAMGIQNGVQVSNNGIDVHWQTQICNPILPLVIGIWFYIGVMFPVLICYFKVLSKLRIVCENCLDVSSFNISDPKGMYGLEGIGGLVNTFLSITLLSSFPMLMFQVTTKNEIELGNLAGFLILGFIIYHAVLSPMLLLNKGLQEVRQKYLNDALIEWQELQNQICS